MPLPRHDRLPGFDAEPILARVGEGRSSRAHAWGETVFAQGDAANSVHDVRKDEPKLSVVSTEGKEAIVAMLGPRDFFGEACLAGHERRFASAFVTRLDAVASTRRTGLGVARRPVG